MGGVRSHAAVLIILLFIVVTVSREVQAVPAAPFIHQLRQPDGGSFAARQWGDEFRAGWETAAGYTVLFDPELLAWTYAQNGYDGGLSSSRRKVGTELPPGLAHGVRPKKGHGLIRRKRPFTGTSAVSSGSVSAVAGNAVRSPAASSPTRWNIPVILINFSDTVTTHSVAEFTSLLFGTGNWSFKEYYEEVSGGAFTVTPGPSGVQGWYTAVNGHDYYGQPSGWGPPDKWPGELAYEAVAQADAAVDFSAYDADGDCVVDLVAIIHQGPAQEASAATADIWSHSWSLSDTYRYGLSLHGPYTTNDVCPSDPQRFMVVDDYIIMPETLPAGLDPGITTIGVFAHEFGHTLGLIDLYDSDRSSEGVGNWSLMASGSWGKVDRYGDRPSHLDPWSKRALGWLEPVRVLASEVGKTLPTVVGGSQVWQFRDGSPAVGGEYFLVENRQQSGFDAALPGAGLLLWHIDESRSNNKSEWYPGCSNCSSHYKVALVQADNVYNLEHGANRGDAGDPFPGSTNKRSVGPVTSPAARLYSGNSAGFSLSSISDIGPMMSADITLSDGIPPETTITAAPPSLTSSVTADFSFIASEAATFECRLDSGSYLACSSPVTLTGLGEGSHTFAVRAIDLAGNIDLSPAPYSWSVARNVLLNVPGQQDSFHVTLGAALSTVTSAIPAQILARAVEFTDNLIIDSCAAVTILGGYAPGFSTIVGQSTIVGTVAITCGKLTAQGVAIRSTQ